MTDEKLKQFKEATLCDSTLMQLKQVCQNGWPETRQECPEICLEYWNVRDEMSSVDGIIYKGHKIVVPKSLRIEMLSKIHETHQGVVKCKVRARDVLFWPGMMKEIEQVVLKCSLCNQYANMQPREPLMVHEVPGQPWMKVSGDLFEFKGAHYLLCVDYFSKYPELVCLGKNIKAKDVIDALKSIFSRQGIPLIFFSDNGPQFFCAEFRTFAQDWEFQHETSSPRYPRSNGQIERMIQTVKRFMYKSDEPHLALLEYRSTPIDGLGYTPSQLLMGRRLRTKIPISKSLLRPKTVNYQRVKMNIKAKQAKYKEWYDRGTKPQLPLRKGEGVRVWNEREKNLETSSGSTSSRKTKVICGTDRNRDKPHKKQTAHQSIARQK